LQYRLGVVGVTDRYLARRVGAPLLAITLVMGVVVSLWQLGRVSHMVLVSLRDVGLLTAIVVDLAPGFAGIALATAGIFGCLLAYDRMAEDGELSALAAAGVPTWRVLVPATVGGLVMGAAVLGAGVWGEPWGATRYNRDVGLLATRSFSRTVQPGTFTGVGALASLYAGRIVVGPDGGARWENVVLGRDLAAGPLMMTAREASVRPAGIGLLHMQASRGEALVPSGNREVVNRLSFREASVTVDVASWVRGETMTLHGFQAWEFSRLWAASGRSGSDGDGGKLSFHLWQKLALPVTVPILCLVGAMVGGQRASQARGRAYILAALTVALCFGLLGLGRNLVIKEALPGWLGANLPNVAGVVLLAWLWRVKVRLSA
jgi:hypothetical protein